MNAGTVADQGDQGQGSGGLRWIELMLGLGGVVLGAALVALVPELRHSVSLALHGDLHGLRHQIRGLGATGPLLLLGVIMAHAVLFYPAEIVTAAAGFAYGFLPGLALVSACWLASALFAFGLGSSVARPLLYRVFGQRRFSGLEQAVRRGGVPLLLAARLIPVVPFSLMCYVAGAARVGVWRFLWTTAVGFLPMTAAVAYLGSRAESLSLSDPLVWVAVGVMLALVASTRYIGLARTAPVED